jgi:flavin reductase (DIM6/NTAB) family NADH-FMN oxidoreductase RutF
MSSRTFTHADLDQLDRSFRRNLINCLSGFKSLCLCGTISPSGQANLSLISSVIHVGANPPLMGMLMRPHVVPRHTLENIEATGYFTLNHVTEAMYEQAHQASAKYARDESEFEATGLTPQVSPLSPAPYVAEAPVRIGLHFKERHHILANATILIVGEIRELCLPEAALEDDGYLDLQVAGSLAVNGLDGYYRGERLRRLAYPRPGQPPQTLPTP